MERNLKKDNVVHGEFFVLDLNAQTLKKLVA